MAEARVVHATEAAWDDVVGQCGHDFHHRRSYHLLARDSGEGEPWLAVYSDGDRLIAWPYLRRPIPGTGLFDGSSVYGYSGPVSGGRESQSCVDGVDGVDGFAAEACAAFRDVWSEQGLVSLFTRFNPLLENSVLATGLHGDPGSPEPALRVLGRSVSIDLGPTDEERLAGYDKNTRYEIRRSSRAGLDVHVDAGFEQLPALVSLYRETMARNGAEERYLFDEVYFGRLVEALGSEAVLLVASIDGAVVGCLLIVVRGPYAHAHLTGVAETHLGVSPLKPLLHLGAYEARRRGARYLHLGAGRGGAEDSLFGFKRKLGSVMHEFVVGRWVLDASAHDELNAGASPCSTAAGDFFPRYRAPQGVVASAPTSRR